MNEGETSRKQFLISSMSSLGMAWRATYWPAIAAAQEHAQHMAQSEQLAYQFFDAHQAVEIEAMAAQIIPTDVTAGARETVRRWIS